jgi:trans-aconitate methyltransferase
MTTADPRAHWQSVWSSKRPEEVSWFQERSSMSFELITTLAPQRDAAIIDVGGGASRLVDALLDAGYSKLTVLDIAAPALEAAKERLGSRGATVEWIAEDVLTHRPTRRYRVWHDRAMLHFLQSDEDVASYRAVLERSLEPSGFAVIATFAPDGPNRCSNLEVRRYEGDAMRLALGDRFELVDERSETHVTPWKAEQRFRWFVMRRR